MLVSTPDATDFLDMSQVDSGLSAMLGEPEIDAICGPDIQSSKIELRSGVKKLLALANDPTRNDVQRHAAAKELAGKVSERLGKAKDAIEKRVVALRDQTFATANRELGPKVETGALESEIRDWLYEVAGKSDALAIIRDAMKESPDLARVLWHSPRFLCGLPEKAFNDLRFEALASVRPDLVENLETSDKLEKLATKYAKALKRVHGSFYNSAIAAQMSKRVEV